jgi:hypothetical protein
LGRAEACKQGASWETVDGVDAGSSASGKNDSFRRDGRLAIKVVRLSCFSANDGR